MNLFERMRRRADNRRAYVDLLRMDDRTLADMGITRHEVSQLMHGRSRTGNRGHE